ncbi:MAG: sugar phosphorylase [Planctomycetota bacterium]|nr:MAG: sugar phosphorylase [Planctomycetota bacterium]
MPPTPEPARIGGRSPRPRTPSTGPAPHQTAETCPAHADGLEASRVPRIAAERGASPSLRIRRTRYHLDHRPSAPTLQTFTRHPDMLNQTAIRSRIQQHLSVLYPGRERELTEAVLSVLRRRQPDLSDEARRVGAGRRADVRWDEQDVALITYGDQVRRRDEPPLKTLHDFLVTHGYHALLRIVHVLPFFPYSSDDGFAVIDYRRVDPNLGDWSDVARLRERFELMFDLVLNHTSARCEWFRKFLRGEQPFERFYIEVDPSVDLSAVVRPRSTPLLTPFRIGDRTRYVWTTFSADQVDLNYAEPRVLLEMLDILLEYVARGARIVRLDAIAYLWKRIGTPCIHLPETHEVVKLFHTVLEAVAPWAILLTETNVPHAENISYFGAGDEAHMVYQFSLPPLLLDAMLHQDAGPLVAWLKQLAPPPPGCTFLNFTASHDGIGVRPLEGLVSEERLQQLVEATRQRGGFVGTRRRSDGTDAPYELNITWFDALSDPAATPELNVRRFLTTQMMMLSLQGVPAVYFHSLFGAHNDRAAAQRTGIPRRINRHKFGWDELQRLLADERSTHPAVFSGYKRILACRREQPAFHPDAPQIVLELGDPRLVGWLRTSIDGRQRIACVFNVSTRPMSVPLPEVLQRANVPCGAAVDLLASRRPVTWPLPIPPCGGRWIEISTAAA